MKMADIEAQLRARGLDLTQEPAQDSAPAAASPLSAIGRALSAAVPAGGDLSRLPPLPAALVETDGGDPVLLRGTVALLGGAGGVGKSWLALDLAIAVALGKQASWPRKSGQMVRGWRVAEAPGKVLYLGAEDSAAALHARCERLCEARGDDVARDLGDRLLIASIADGGGGGGALVTRSKTDKGMIETLAGDDLRKHVATGGYSLVIVDPGSRFLGAEAELDPGAATAAIDALLNLATGADGPLVLACMHSTKAARREGTADAASVRGSSALTDGVRAVLEITANGGAGLLTHSKSNSTIQAQPLPLIREAADGAPIAGWAAATHADRAKLSARADRRAKFEALADHVSQVAGMAGGVEKDKWADLADALKVPDMPTRKTLALVGAPFPERLAEVLHVWDSCPDFARPKDDATNANATNANATNTGRGKAGKGTGSAAEGLPT